MGTFSKLKLVLLHSRRGPIESIEMHLRDQLRSSERELIADKAALVADTPRDNASVVHGNDKIIQRMQHMATKSVDGIKRMVMRKSEALANVRRFQIDHGIQRDARHPDRFKTALMLMAGFIVEGLLGGALFVADGHFGIPAAMATGFAVAGINMMTATAMGYFAGRYISYKLDAPHVDVRAGLIRLLAWIGMAASTLGLCVLHYGASRVRATGDHSNIFTFDEVSFLATFNDYFSLALMTVGVVGGVIAFFKGRNGISDPIIGYSEISKAADEHINHAAERMYDDALARLDDVYEDARATLEEYGDDAAAQANDFHTALRKVNDGILQHNNAVDAAMDELRARQTSHRRYLTYVGQKQQKPVAVNYKSFEALRMELVEMDVADSTDQALDSAALLAASHEAYSEAISAIEEAYSDFLTPITEFTLTNIQGEYNE